MMRGLGKDVERLGKVDERLEFRVPYPEGWGLFGVFFYYI